MAFPVKHVECKSNDRFWSSQKIIDCEITFDKQSTWGKSVLAISLYKRSTFSKVDPWRLQSWISVKLQQWKQNSPENLPTMTMGFRNFMSHWFYYILLLHALSAWHVIHPIDSIIKKHEIGYSLLDLHLYLHPTGLLPLFKQGKSRLSIWVILFTG